MQNLALTETQINVNNYYVQKYSNYTQAGTLA